MNISGIRPQMGFYSYNSINTQQASKSAQVEEQQQLSTAAVEQESTSAASSSVAAVEEPSKQTFGAYDYAQQYQPNQEYSLKGANSSLDSLDVEQAVGAMQKDQVLHQYQYFVGANQASTATVRGSEDFSL